METEDQSDVDIIDIGQLSSITTFVRHDSDGVYNDHIINAVLIK